VKTSKGEDSFEKIVVVYNIYFNESVPVKVRYILRLRSIGISTGRITVGGIPTGGTLQRPPHSCATLLLTRQGNAGSGKGKGNQGLIRLW
jgi:hypothetical protein